MLKIVGWTVASWSKDGGQRNFVIQNVTSRKWRYSRRLLYNCPRIRQSIQIE